MGLTRLHAFLRRHRRIALDASVFIYQLENNRKYAVFTDPIFAWLERTGRQCGNDDDRFDELLVKPYRESSQERINRFYALLTTFPNLDWIAPNLEIADITARIRAAYNLRIPDGLLAATAVKSQGTGLVTNDAVFQRVQAFETMVLDDLV